MRPLTEDDVRASFVNARADEVSLVALPADFVLTDWDHLDFFAWRDPRTHARGYVVAEVAGRPTGIVLRAAESATRARAAICDLCHTMQPGDQVSLFTARKVGDAGARGDSVGTYICADLSCHENVRLAAPLAPSEIRSSVDRKIEGTRARTEALVERVLVTA